MSSKYIEEKSCWLVSYSKRNPVTGKAQSLRRYVKQKSKIAQVERELVAQVERKIAEKIVPKWKSVVESYLEACRIRGLGEQTIYNTEKCLKAATFDLWSDKLVNEITTQEIRDLILQTYGEHSQSHQKSILKFIKQVFEHALERGDINRNPSPRLAFRIGDKIKKVLTEEQVKTLLNRAKEYNWVWYPHYAMALYTGMRNGELYALTWDKVTLNERQILVDCAWNNKDGFKDTKSGDDRIVEIAPNLLPVLEELKLKSGMSHFVLPRMREWDKGDQARELRKFLVGIGLPEVRFHDLRATWATIMLSKGVAPAKVMMMGGWKDMKTMMIYMRKAGIDIKGITDCLELHNPRIQEAKVLALRS